MDRQHSCSQHLGRHLAAHAQPQDSNIAQNTSLPFHLDNFSFCSIYSSIQINPYSCQPSSNHRHLQVLTCKLPQQSANRNKSKCNTDSNNSNSNSNSNYTLNAASTTCTALSRLNTASTTRCTGYRQPLPTRFEAL